MFVTRHQWTAGGEALSLTLRQPPCTHHEGVLHSDDGTVQYGGRHRGDLEQLALPALALPLLQRFSPQVGHQLLDLPALALGEEGLCLVQRRFGHHDSGRTVFHLGKDLDGLAWERGEKRSVCQTERGRDTGETLEGNTERKTRMNVKKRRGSPGV